MLIYLLAYFLISVWVCLRVCLFIGCFGYSCVTSGCCDGLPSVCVGVPVCVCVLGGRVCVGRVRGCV